MTGRGSVSPLLPIVPDALIAADPRYHLVIVEPDARNSRVHRALHSTGWGDDGEVQRRDDRRVRIFHRPDRRIAPDLHDV